jgi:ketosteroid isomerase-like protein
LDVDGNAAWGSYYNEATIRVADGTVRNVQWLESAVLIKQGNDWKIKLLHSTRIRQ